MAERADIFFRPNPSTDAVWLNAVAKYILDHNLAKHGLHRHSGSTTSTSYKARSSPSPSNTPSSVTGVPAATIITVANEIAAADGVCILWAMGVTQHCGGSDTSTAISNLLLLTGNYMRPGAGAYPLRGHNNVQGASDFGSMPNIFSGYQKVDDDDDPRASSKPTGACTLAHHQGPRQPRDDRRHPRGQAARPSTSRAKTPSPPTPTPTTSARPCASSTSSSCRTSTSPRPAATPTSSCPPRPSLEKDGTFTSTERRIQRLYKALRAARRIQARLGDHPAHRQPARRQVELQPSLRRSWMRSRASRPLFAGVTYERLEGYKSLQWPVARRRHRHAALLRRQVPLPRRQGQASTASSTSRRRKRAATAYDLHLNNGRLLEHFEQGSHDLPHRPASARSRPTTSSRSRPSSPPNAASPAGATSSSPRPTAACACRSLVTDRVQGKQLYMPLNSVEEPVNKLTSSATRTAPPTRPPSRRPPST